LSPCPLSKTPSKGLSTREHMLASGSLAGGAEGTEGAWRSAASRIGAWNAGATAASQRLGPLGTPHVLLRAWGFSALTREKTGFAAVRYWNLETLLPFNHIPITPKPLDEHLHWIALLLVVVNLILLPKPPQQRNKNIRSIPAPECAIAESRPRFTASVQAAPAPPRSSRTCDHAISIHVKQTANHIS